ncbi:MAG: hypothetical protein DRJ68_06950 [Thermoprotei archaeon]|nr:MAG: hypothetical protein DRJ68_06950 [Thermoprotei archaeon]
MSQELMKKYASISEAEFENLLTAEEKKWGSGWDPASIKEELGYFEPLPYATALQTCEAQKTKMFGALFKKPSPQEVVVTSARLEVRPYWVVSGYYFCAFLRDAEYMVYVNPDVLAVYLEGKVRQIAQPQPQVAAAPAPAPQPQQQEKGKLGFLKKLTPISRQPQPQPQQVQQGFFQLKDAIELARVYNEAYIYMNGITGVEDIMFAQTYAEHYGAVRTANDLEEIRKAYWERASGIHVIGPDPPAVSKEKVVEDLKVKVFSQPATYKKVVENVFDITRLSLVYMPFYHFELQYRDRIGTMIINGVSGKSLNVT